MCQKVGGTLTVVSVCSRKNRLNTKCQGGALIPSFPPWLLDPRACGPSLPVSQLTVLPLPACYDIHQFSSPHPYLTTYCFQPPSFPLLCVMFFPLLLCFEGCYAAFSQLTWNAACQFFHKISNLIHSISRSFPECFTWLFIPQLPHSQSCQLKTCLSFRSSVSQEKEKHFKDQKWLIVIHVHLLIRCISSKSNCVEKQTLKGLNYRIKNNMEDQVILLGENAWVIFLVVRFSCKV